MANVKELIDELKTIGQAFTGLGSFDFKDPSEVNADRGREYPYLLIDRNLNAQNFTIVEGKTTYRISFNFYDRFWREDDKSTPSQDAESDLFLIARQYIREFNRRQKSNQNKWSEATGSVLNFDFDQDLDRLIRLTLLVQITLREDCTNGTFEY